MSGRVRIGVVGCGLIAQVMHLHYLTELDDRFELAAVCDLSEPVASACAARYGAPAVFTDAEQLMTASLDAVLIASSGDHAPIAIAAAAAGLHVLVEKPMALAADDAQAMVNSARDAGVTLMVGTMKRYDPAYERLAELLGDPGDVRLVRVTTLESPFAPYVAHYPLAGPSLVAPEIIERAQAQERQILARALPDADERTRECYRWILLDTLVHELNALRGILGMPSEVVSAALSPRCVALHLRFGEIDCHLSWVDLPGVARYEQEFAFYAPARRLTLQLPSPFLRSAPSRLIVEGGEPGTAHSFGREEIVSYDEAFRRELIEFADCIAGEREPRTSGTDGWHDVRLCELIARAAGTSAPLSTGDRAVPEPVGSLR